MLKDLTRSQPLWLTLAQKAIHPSWVKAALLKLPFNKIQSGSLTLTIKDECLRFEGKESGPHAELIIKHPLRAYWLMKVQGQIGFAQAYVEGAVETTSLYNLLELGQANRNVWQAFFDVQAGNWWQQRQHRQRHNSKGNSRKNISYHYDLGNDFYQLWLDESMTYSSGLGVSKECSLASSQAAKYQRIWQELEVGEGANLLEIGCGWGGFMELSVQNGASIKGLTLSTEQAAYAKQRLLPYGEDKFDVALQDYRDETQQYDGVVSIEMFEAVGKEYWDAYFSMLKRSLKPGAKAVLQIITIEDEHAEEYQAGVDFIQAYIFPGGLLPSVPQLKSLAQTHGLHWCNEFDFGQDYARTCSEWKQSFNHHSDTLVKMGYDAAFQRLWNFYLDYCAVGFVSGHISVHQITLQK